MKTLISVLLLSLVAWSVHAEDTNSPPMRYTNGWPATIKFGMDLYKELKPDQKAKVHIKPINVETDVTPFARLEELKSDDLPRPMATVFVSVGFIDLVNNVAHAKAIDRIQKKYFENYVLSLAQESGDKELKELPNITDKRYWTDEMMNDQVSNFNQIVGVVVGTKLAHYYLGHYKKYESKLFTADGKPVPINTLLTPEEWEEALRYGVANSIKCGLGIEGVTALFECIDKMPKRPEWTLYFMPEKVKLSRIKSEMKKIEKKILSGGDI